MSTEYKGKHAELCRAIASAKRDEALEIIYAFFRSEENTDSYSISLLTIVRELIEDSDSDALYQLRIRMRNQGDRVLINMAQFVMAFEEGEFEDAAETLAGKCVAELPKLARSMQEYADEEGLSPATQMAGLRIREAVRLLMDYFKSHHDTKALEKCMDANLEMTRAFLFEYAHYMTADMLMIAKAAEKRHDEARQIKMCRELVSGYADKLDVLKKTSQPDHELLECIAALKYAYEKLNTIDPDTPYSEELATIQTCAI
ncbi:MAG: hypothetical protein IIY06_03990 [Proteobacteria bacterium]|nr:hypothetical protein [Pseudomonadota bacterium]